MDGINKINDYLVDILGMVGCFGFITYYYFAIHLKVTERYKELNVNVFFNYLKVLGGFLLYDPFVILVAPCLLLLALHQIFVKKIRKWEWIDSLLISLLFFSAVYPILGIWEFYYFVPANAFLALVLASRLETSWKSKYVKPFIIIASILWITNTAPESIHQFFWNKEIPKNFQATLKFFKENPVTRPTNVLLVGIDINRSGGEFVGSIQRYATYNGIKNINFCSDPCSSKTKIDYYLITPYSLSSDVNIKEFRANKDKAIFATTFPITMPDLTLKGLIRRVFQPLINSFVRLKLEDRYFWHDYNFYIFKKG